MSLVQLPSILTFLYPNRLWRGPEFERKVTLTFDDGPVPGVTDWVLDELAKRGLGATFFMVGDNVRKHPSLAKEVIAAGQQVGNHTFRHLSGWGTSTAAYLEDVAACDRLLEDSLGVQTRLFRPPYGWMKPLQAREVAKDKKIVMWSLLSYDFDSHLAPEKIIQVCTSRTSSGSILVFHDQEKTKEQLKKVLPQYLDFLVGEGFATQPILG
ncbi:MAG: polysaccharide deacetylase family protein [Algoriphagus sp.]|nr:polysaccharide deacetylase family protein [Algoriphagus sp.]